MIEISMQLLCPVSGYGLMQMENVYDRSRLYEKYLDKYQQLRQCSTVHLRGNRFNRTSTKPLCVHL